MPPHEWSSTAYVEDWTVRDNKEAMLSVPWRISAELVRDDLGSVQHIVDLGSGPGGFLEVMLDAFPGATATWVDQSEPMLERAKERLDPLGHRVTFMLADAGDAGSLMLPEADVITSSRMIHHFAPARTQDLYRVIHDSLRVGGWFCNVDHFAAPDDFEARYRRIKPALTGRAKRAGGGGHSHEAPFSLVAEHLSWLADAGFVAGDSPWRTLWTSLIVARRG
ncbi:MAG: class I SAM-dependent methyltransferase [Actinomycetota bacterium]|nr:class I SAM-dependent methyltransferase [Actinomycetota bacterium]